LRLTQGRLSSAPGLVARNRDRRAGRCEDWQKIMLMPHDFSPAPPYELLARLTGMSAAAHRIARQIGNVPAPAQDAPARGEHRSRSKGIAPMPRG
jgi:hypothetical protein